QPHLRIERRVDPGADAAVDTDPADQGSRVRAARHGIETQAKKKRPRDSSASLFMRLHLYRPPFPAGLAAASLSVPAARASSGSAKLTSLPRCLSMLRMPTLSVALR